MIPAALVNALDVFGEARYLGGHHEGFSIAADFAHVPVGAESLDAHAPLLIFLVGPEDGSLIQRGVQMASFFVRGVVAQAEDHPLVERISVVLVEVHLGVWDTAVFGIGLAESAVEGRYIFATDATSSLGPFTAIYFPAMGLRFVRCIEAEDKGVCA